MPGETPHAGDGVTAPKEKQRLLSLDALRGFDMFWIVGGAWLVFDLSKLTEWRFLEPVKIQLHHCRWDGFHFYDMIFPLFVFISGVTLGLSNKHFRELEPRERRRRYFHAFKRLFLLIFLCALYNRAHGWGDFESFGGPRYAGVLTRIAVAWFFGALIVWHFRLRGQAIIAAAILLGYWGLHAWYAHAFPGKGTVNAWVDSRYLPGFILGKSMDPEGILSSLPAIVNALFGAFAGRWLRSRAGTLKKAGLLFAAGAMLLALGWLWNGAFPVNKKLWTSSYVFVSCGWSAMLLAVFYLVIDGGKYGKVLGRPLAVLGANALLVYFAFTMVDWRYTSDRLFGGFIQWAPEAWWPLLRDAGVVMLEWTILAGLYRRKIFIRI